MPCEEEEDEINPAYGRTDDRAPDTFCERYRGRSISLYDSKTTRMLQAVSSRLSYISLPRQRPLRR